MHLRTRHNESCNRRGTTTTVPEPRPASTNHPNVRIVDGTCTVTAEWKELPPNEVMVWNKRVYDAGGRLWQLPFWRTFLDRSGLRTRYFVEEERGEIRTWVCVMEVGLPG